MIDKKFLDLKNLIEELNDSMYEHIDEDVPLPAIEFRPFVLTSDGFVISVSFMNYPCWDSDDDPDLSLNGIKDQIIEESKDALKSIKMMRINLEE